MAFGGFKNKFKKNAAPQQKQQGNNEFGEQQVFRARIPRGREVIGVVSQRVGAARMLVKCYDGKERNCRVPGRLKRKLWLREGDTVLVEPWEFDDTKGDVTFKYTNAEVQWMQRKGIIQQVEGEF
jgi:translation initiation factor 1A